MEKINKKILIVEDDKDLSFIFKSRFLSEGFLVFLAEDGEQGVEVAQKENPDLIISDVLMPKLNGIEMAQKIRQLGSNVPIVFLTNIKDGDYIDTIKKSGEFDYLIKSDLRVDEIVDRVKAKMN